MGSHEAPREICPCSPCPARLRLALEVLAARLYDLKAWTLVARGIVLWAITFLLPCGQPQNLWLGCVIPTLSRLSTNTLLSVLVTGLLCRWLPGRIQPLVTAVTGKL